MVGIRDTWKGLITRIATQFTLTSSNWLMLVHLKINTKAFNKSSKVEQLTIII
jgi:hypothetical protein